MLEYEFKQAVHDIGIPFNFWDSLKETDLDQILEDNLTKDMLTDAIKIVKNFEDLYEKEVLQ